MPFRYHETVNIYDTEAMARYIRTQETQFTVLQGKISALITDSELQTLRAGGSTMYSRMTSVEATAEGLTSQVSTLQTNLTNNYSTTEAMNSAITQKATEITTSVSRTLQNYSTTQQMNAAISQKATEITTSVASTITGIDGRLKKAEQKITDESIISTVTSSSGATAMVSSINQSADTVKIQAAHINLIGAVTADCIASGAVTADKIGAGAVTADKIQAGTITGTQIQAGSISAASLDIASIFAQDVTATGTIRGANLVGATAQIENGSIGGWTLVDGVLTNPEYNVALTGEALNLIESHVSQMYIDMYEPAGMIQFSIEPKINTNATNIETLQTTTADHETRIGNLESAPAPEYPRSPDFLRVQVDDNLTVDHTISCTTLSVSGTATANKFKGSYDNGTGTIAVWSGGELKGQSSSSRRYKKDMGLVNVSQAREVLNVPVVNFQYKPGYLADGDEKEGVTIPGFFAEDVERCIPEAVYHNKDGKVENWMERIMLPLMLRVIQDQQHRIEELERKR